MGFDQIIGQDKAIYLLAKSMAGGRLHHAYRFEGPAGTGKTMTAAALSASLNCLAPATVTLQSGFGGAQEEVQFSDFCGTCKSCQKIPLGESHDAPPHPDVIYIAPEGQSRLIKIEQIRQLQSIIVYSPVEGKARSIIIKDAENITEAASNAFLKILEEPPRDTYFFLITSRPHKLLPTIRSRTTVIRFSPLSIENVKKIIRDTAGAVDASHLSLAASLSGGSVSRALSYIEDREAAEEALKFVFNFDKNLMLAPESILDVLDSSGVSKNSVENFLHLIGIYYRDIAWYIETGRGEGLMLKPIEDRIVKRAKTLSAEEASSICWKVSEALRLLEFNANPRMLFEKIIFELRSGATP